jgi:hypothetical protein
MPGGSVLVRLYAGRLHNLSPLFGFGGDETPFPLACSDATFPHGNIS